MSATAARSGIRPGRFVLRVAAWLPAAFLVWYLAAPVLAWPVAMLTTIVTRTAFSDLVESVEQHGHELVITSTLKPPVATTESMSRGLLSIDVNVLLYSFGWPMLAALILAAREPRPLRTMLVGYVVLIPFVTWGLVSEFLKHLVFDTGPVVASQTGFGALQREGIAYAYQFGVLILPTVAPAVFWVLTHRRFLEAFAQRPTPAGAHRQ